MYKRKNTRKRIRIAASITAILVVAVSIAFAALQQTLNISFGSVTQTAMTWGVGFKGTSATPTQEGTSTTGLSCGTASITTSTVTITQSTLSKPGDKCTYNLTIENTGDVPARLSSISQTQPNSTSCSTSGGTMVCGNITYTLTKDNGSELEVDTIINNASTLDLKLVISYTGTELNGTQTSQRGASFTLTYQQSDTGAAEVDLTDPNRIICKRATTLHTEQCTRNSELGCVEAGYKTDRAKGTETVTYGSLGTSGTLTSGDAFDCDVNADGIFNSETERFYYVSGKDGDSSSSYATLIYYSDVSSGVPDESGMTGYAYNNASEARNGYNYLGPTDAYEQLPTTSQWKNVTLSNQTRQIHTTTGDTKITTYEGEEIALPQFTYTGRAARLLSVKEVNAGCNITAGGFSSAEGELDTNCQYLLENTFFTLNTGNAHNYWLEDVYTPGEEHILTIAGYGRNIYVGYANYPWRVRPAIEVNKNNIEY